MRRVLLTGLGVVVGLLLTLGLYAVRSLSSVSRTGTATARQYLEQSERLERARFLLSSAAGAVRDYLIDSDTSALSRHREEANRSWSQATSAILDYEQFAPVGRRPVINQLNTQVWDYWAITSPALEITGYRRAQVGADLLIGQLVPSRDRLLATIAVIAVNDRADLRSAAAITAQFVQEAERHLWTAIMLTVLLSLLVAGTTVRYLVRLENTTLAQYTASVKAAFELEGLSRRLLTLQDDERRGIARELHDDFGQRIASLLFGLSAVAQRPDATPDMRLAIQEMEGHLADVSKDLQQLSRSLHSAVLDKIGLESAVRSECNALRHRTAWDIDFQSSAVPKRLPEPLSLAAYRVFQEALQNAIRHSGTNRLGVFLAVDGSDLVLRIVDYGSGFDPEAASRNGSLGLVSMRERLRMVGGTFAIHSEIGKGTQVEARIPVVTPGQP